MLFSKVWKTGCLLLLLLPVATGSRAWAADEQPEYGHAEAAPMEQRPEGVIDTQALLLQLEKEVQAGSRLELREALQLYKADKLAEAIAALESLIERDPTVMTAWDFLGQAYLKAGRQDDTLKLWARLKAIRSDYFPLYNWMGRVHMLRGEYASAIDAFRTSLRLQPAQEREDTKLNLARLLRWSGCLEEASALLRPLQQAAPQNLAVKRELASALLSNREYEEALPLWADLQASAPTNLLFLAKLSVALFHNGQVGAALERARRVLAEEPNNMDALRLMADEAQFHSDAPEEALAWLRRMIDQATEFKLKRQLSLRYVFLYMRLKGSHPERYPSDRPAAILGQLLAADPYDVDLAMAYAEVLIGDQQYAKARQQLERVLRELNPNSIRAQNNLFDISVEEKNYAEAWKHYQLRAAFNPQDPYLHYLLARLYIAQERYRAAHREVDQLELAGRRGGVAVLLYHGLSASETGEVLPALRLREQLTALQRAGFRFLSAHELPEYFAKRARLSGALGASSMERVACVTFDDARRDTMRYGTPVGQDLKIPFSMHIPVGFVLQQHAFICTWDMLRTYQAAGCWHYGGHTLYAHKRAPIDAAQRLGFALPNHLWLASAQRLETDSEYAARLSREYAECQALITRELGHANECNFFAYPFGDIGQITRCNDPEAPRKNLAYAARSYALGFIQTSYGYAVAGDNPLLYQRHEPDRGDSAQDVLNHVLINHPLQLARRVRADLAAYEDKRQLLLGTLRAMQLDGYPADAFQKLVGDLERKLGRHIPLAEIEQAQPAAPVPPLKDLAPADVPSPGKPDAVVPPTPDAPPEAPRKPVQRPAGDFFDSGRPGLRDLRNPLK
jgi:predicted Zn-dependent protease